MGRHSRETHHYAVGFLAFGCLNELSHHQGRAVVHIDRVGEVEDHYLVVADVSANSVNQLAGGRDGKGGGHGLSMLQKIGRGEWIRTTGLHVPNVAR